MKKTAFSLLFALTLGISAAQASSFVITTTESLSSSLEITIKGILSPFISTSKISSNNKTQIMLQKDAAKTYLAQGIMTEELNETLVFIQDTARSSDSPYSAEILEMSPEQLCAEIVATAESIS